MLFNVDQILNSYLYNHTNTIMLFILSNFIEAILIPIIKSFLSRLILFLYQDVELPSSK